jgi:cytochrome c551/c552
MPYAKALKLAVSGLVAAVTITSLAFAMLAWSGLDVRATPAIAKGKPCKTCHSSSKPGKGDLK